jgi:aryl-alcohol dehydrogenase-like predicted oxidoreductase
MDYRSLGRSGLWVSNYALGTMTFGAEADEATSHQMLDVFVEAGGTVIDTADVYSNGVSEEIIGHWLRGRSDRESLVIATKGRFPMGTGPNDSGSSRAHITRAVDASLTRLGVDVIDLYQLHGWDPDTPIEESLQTLTDLVSQGKIRYVGVSNFTGFQLAKTVTLTHWKEFAPIASLQPQYNLLERHIEWELMPLCVEEGLGVMPWSPLGGGWLSGKYRRTERPTGDTRLGDDPDRGVEAYDIRNTDRVWAILDIVGLIADEVGASMAQVALAWLVDRPGVSSVILGARNAEQLSANLAAAATELSEEQRRRLDLVSAPGIPLYPYGFLERYCDYTAWADLGTRVEPPPIGD